MNIIEPRIDHNIESTPFVRDAVIMPVLRDAGVVEGYEGIIPAVLYGKAPTQRDPGSIGVLYGSYHALLEEIDEAINSPKPYFNPHGSTRTKGMSLAKKVKGRGEIFAKSSYLLQSGNEGRHLVAEGNELPWLDEDAARRVITVYELSAMTIARTVTITRQDTKTTELSPLALLPGLLRETAQNILPIYRNHNQRVEALSSAMKSLAKGQSPQYK